MVKMVRWRTKVARVAIALAIGCVTLFSGGTTASAQSNVQWVHNFTSSQDIELTAISLSASGEVVIAGTFHGTVDFDPGVGEALLTSGTSNTSFIARYTPAGALIWAYRLMGSGDVVINDIVVDPMSQIGVVGSFEGSADLDPGAGVFQVRSKGGHDIFLLRLLPDGNLQWGWTAGDAEDDMGFAVTTNAFSALFITGKFEGRIFWQGGNSPTYELSSVGGTDIFAARFNNAGNLFWIRTWGGDEDDSGIDLALQGNDNAFVVGTFAGEADLDPLWTSTEVRSRGRSDIFITMLNQTGDTRWITHMGSTGSESNPTILVEPDGSLYVSAQFENRIDFVSNKDVTVDSRGLQDIFIARFGPPNGRLLLWAHGIGGAQNETLAGIAQDGFGNLYIMGTFAGVADFALGAATNELTSSGAADIFLGKYSRDGELHRVQAMVNPQDERARALAISNGNDVIIGGEFSGSIDLGSGLVINTGRPAGVYNVFVAHYARDTWTPLLSRSYLPGIQAPAAQGE